MRSSQGSRGWSGLLAATVATLVLTGCGDDGSPTQREGKPRGATATTGAEPAAGGDAFLVRYSVKGSGEDGDVHQQLEVVVAGDRVRFTVIAGGDGGAAQGFRTIWDGTTLLVHDPESQPVDTRVVGPDTDEYGPPPVFVYQTGSEAFQKVCPKARPVGTLAFLGRTGLRHSCAATAEDSGASMEAHEMTLDRETGLVLRDIGRSFALVATRISPEPHIDETTFSTELPDGAGNGPQLPDVRLPQVGGGTLDLSDYRDGALIVVIGEVRGIRQLLDRLAPVTRNGTVPPVVAMLNVVPPDGWTGTLLNAQDVAAFTKSVSKTAGTFAVPVGIDIKGAASNELRSYEQMQAGLSVVVAVEGGRIDFTTTDAELATSDTALRAWIAENS